MRYNAEELFNILLLSDENCTIETKQESSVDRSILEPICAFSNEPLLGGGYIIPGISESEDILSHNRINDLQFLENEILNLCPYRPYKLSEMSIILGRSTNYLYQRFVKRLVRDGRLTNTISQITNHPDQAYQVTNNPNNKSN